MPRAVLTFADEDGQLWTVAAVLDVARGPDGAEKEFTKQACQFWRLKDIKVILEPGADRL